MAGNYKFKEIEQKILDFWDKDQTYKKAKEKGKGKKRFTYLDGPPYTSGKIHLGTAWGKSLRDSIMRYKRMKGFDVWDRAGFDMHGLPTENKVAAKFNFERKEQIEEFGVAKFQEECERFCLENMKIMIEDFKQLGVWMDFEDPYMPIKPEFMEGVWHLTKTAHKNGRLYLGAKVMTWCPRCATSVSKHELEYEEIQDDSIFVKFKIKGKDDEYLVIWTTTPWTIPFNLAIMVNPELDYVKIRVKPKEDKKSSESAKEEKWIIAKGLVGVLMGSVVGREYEIIEEHKGEDLKGIHYKHIFYDDSDVYKELEEEYEHAFSVILSTDYVDLSAGTGLVHCAPGCGPEDYEVGKGYGLPAFNELDEYGTFSEKMKKFSGLVAKRDDHVFIDHIKDAGSLVAKTKVKHDYPTCWRCHGPVIFRPTEQWFFKVEDLRDKMVEFNRNIRWVPNTAFNAFESWLKNIKDNGITRQRFWGTPVPIWQCENHDCKAQDIIGSVKELKEKAGKLPKNFHKPWIDELDWRCGRCSGMMKRIPDIFDVWIDAGSAGWNCYDYPQKKEYFEKYYPADLILEGKDQIRGWFNLLMVGSTLLFGNASFRNVYMHGFINDYRGIKMSKSIGNITSPAEVIDEYGADTLRYYVIGAAKPGADMNYNPEDPKTRIKNLLILWNTHNFLLDAISNTGINPGKVDLQSLSLTLEDRYILSRLHSTIKRVAEMYDNYLLNEPPQAIEDLYLDLSRTYIQSIRDDLSSGEQESKVRIIKVLLVCLENIITIFAPVAPFITEKIYQNLKGVIGYEEGSVHLKDWPEHDENLIDTALEEQIELSDQIVQAALRAREAIQLGVRWPLSELIISTREDKVKKALNILEESIKAQVNVKKITVVERFRHVKHVIKADYNKLGPLCGQHTPQVIAEFAKKPAEAFIDKLNSTGKFTISVSGKEYEITKEHVIIQTTVSDGYAAAEFKEGTIYLVTEQTQDLITEGFAREIMRRVQNVRKNAGLEKKDDISLIIATQESQLENMIIGWKDTIAQKVGASSIEVVDQKPKGSFDCSSDEKVKGKLFSIHIIKK